MEEEIKALQHIQKHFLDKEKKHKEKSEDVISYLTNKHRFNGCVFESIYNIYTNASREKDAKKHRLFERENIFEVGGAFPEEQEAPVDFGEEAEF